jgi:hypothetical protein
MEGELNVNKESIRFITTTDLGQRKIYARFVSHNLCDEEKLR